ncbi:hypothetical protein [Halorubrum vacuolatum]|uniref:Uncharacterized protein n=1 Tax=Halorubrum vacuolatum TaxID=63740 RepID=A0A238VM09_HALVU|nr:hypothetical protein [Halorubrum vacuolatum]SNR35422.1 hypothetical protein SAMN06264855_103122 [Halorubrum vacuolatum]
MSFVSRALRWFNRQETPVQVGSTVVVFVLLFILGVYTAGIVPGLIMIVLAVEHVLRPEETETD